MVNKSEPARVLVVDDESAIRYSFTKTLQRIGYVVDSASNGDEALQLLEQQHYDAVLTDIRMPGGMSGVDLLAQVREKSPDTSVIMITGYASLGTAVESLKLGAHDYLVKPSSSRDIRESVSRGVERARNMRRRRELLNMLQDSVQELSGEEKAPRPVSISTLEEMEESSPGIEFNPREHPVEEMEIGKVKLYPGRYQISVDREMIDLTPTEFDLLLYLAAHRGRVVPCSELVREVRGYGVDETEAREVIRPHVSNLRRKIKNAGDNLDLIVNVRGIGYRLSDVD